MELKRIIEGLLFATHEPLSMDKIQSLLEGVDRATIRACIEKLGKEYQELDRSFRLVEVAGGYQLRTVEELAPWVRKLRRQSPPRLSQASMETLAVIAYRQPVTRAEVEYIRGVDCGAVVRSLMEKGLIKILGRKDGPGRPLLYGTSKKFLEVFGLKDLSSLPALSELEDLPRVEPPAQMEEEASGGTGRDQEEFSQ
ncbi:MAG: SMC-Scp complex subunit ScpB [bacterium]